MSVRSTVVFTDLHGSTAVFGALGNVRATEAITSITLRISNMCSRYRGRLVKTLGDGVMVVFPETSDAIDFVLDVQRLHHRQSGRSVGEVKLPIRIGLACGDIEVLSGDCYGDAVNVAARLCDLCGPDQIWASASVIEKWNGVQVRVSVFWGPSIYGVVWILVMFINWSGEKKSPPIS